MKWLTDMHTAQGMLVLCSVAVLGLAIGSIKVRGISLGVAGTLFAGILFGHLGWNIDPEVRSFMQEFGLILFVYTIGMQVGPSFLASLRRQGLPLNALAAGIVLMGAALTVGLCYALGIDVAAGVGLFAGATTNTPALGAAQEALKGLGGISADRASLPGLGYAVCYPFGILGIILTMILVRAAFRVNSAKELEGFRAAQRAGQPSLKRMNLLVDNPNLDGLAIRAVPGLKELGVVISRIRKAGTPEITTVRADTVLNRGDHLLAVGTKVNLEKFRVIAGQECGENLMDAPGHVIHRRVVVTHKEVLGQTLRQLALDHVYGVTATRLTRADLEIAVSADLKVQFGDMLQLVGTEEAINKAASALGNSVQQLNHTKLIPMFFGIALGVLAGSYPIQFSNVPAPVRLGLAGGPLVIAIALSRIGRIGPLLWYMPVNANVLLREFGIALFLSCVGLRSGANFLETLLKGSGFLWMGVGVAITLVPLIVASLIARRLMKMNFMNLCGLLAGSMTDPPALAFANTVNGTDAPSVAYATVYPLTMLLRIVVAQLMVLFFCR
jgi:putative transport protein